MTGTAGPLDANVPLSFASRNTEDSGETKLQCSEVIAFYWEVPFTKDENLTHF